MQDTTKFDYLKVCSTVWISGMKSYKTTQTYLDVFTSPQKAFCDYVMGDAPSYHQHQFIILKALYQTEKYREKLSRGEAVTENNLSFEKDDVEKYKNRIDRFWNGSKEYAYCYRKIAIWEENDWKMAIQNVFAALATEESVFSDVTIFENMKKTLRQHQDQMNNGLNKLMGMVETVIQSIPKEAPKTNENVLPEHNRWLQMMGAIKFEDTEEDKNTKEWLEILAGNPFKDPKEFKKWLTSD